MQSQLQRAKKAKTRDARSFRAHVAAMQKINLAAKNGPTVSIQKAAWSQSRPRRWQAERGHLSEPHRYVVMADSGFAPTHEAHSTRSTNPPGNRPRSATSLRSHVVA